MKRTMRVAAIGIATLGLAGTLYFFTRNGKPPSSGVPDGNAPQTIMEMITANDRPLQKIIDDCRIVEWQRVDDPEHATRPEEALRVAEDIFKAYELGQAIRVEDILRYAEALDPGVPPASCEGKMMDVDGKGGPEAVIRTEEGGTGGGYQIRILSKEPQAVFCHLFEGDTDGILFEEESLSLDRQVVDLDGDGQVEIIMTSSPWEHGATTIANWPMVYHLESGKFVYAENRFLDFYRTKVLPKYLSAIVPEGRLATTLEKRQWELLRNRDCQIIIDRVNQLGAGGSHPK